MSSVTTLDLLAWLAELDQVSSVPQWHIHKAQITDSLISQDLPIQLIYHYERLDDDIKAQFPLNGSLLKQFNTPMTRAEFANLPELTGINLADIAKPWQLKFTGKLVIFTQNPEVAIRLWWTNTLKAFELVYAKNLEEAIEKSFHHWQFINSVEVICKTPDLILTANSILNNEKTLSQTGWQTGFSTGFESVPSVVSLAIQKILSDSHFVKEHWLPALIKLAQQHRVNQQLLTDTD